MSGFDSVSFNRDLRDLAEELRKAAEDHAHRVQSAAFYERLYRMQKARAYLRTEGKTVGEREAKVDLAEISGDIDIPEEERRHEPHTISDLKYLWDIAEGLKVSALERVRSARAQLSALQSLASLAKEEASFDRTGPRGIA